MLPSERLQALKHMPIVPISQEVADELALDPDYWESYWYRPLQIVDLVPGEIGCHLRANARYVLEQAS